MVLADCLILILECTCNSLFRVLLGLELVECTLVTPYREYKEFVIAILQFVVFVTIVELCGITVC